jgi:hypothetical protein
MRQWHLLNIHPRSDEAMAPFEYSTVEPTSLQGLLATCSDGVQNGHETGVDCGGECPEHDCPNCTDGIRNGYEIGACAFRSELSGHWPFRL